MVGQQAADAADWLCRMVRVLATAPGEFQAKSQSKTSVAKGRGKCR